MTGRGLQTTAADVAGGVVLGGGSADTLWLMICAFLVFFMQCGFALLEAGTVRAKNTKNILLKNLLDACIGALIWWFIGFSIAVRHGGWAAERALVGRAPQTSVRLQTR